MNGVGSIEGARGNLGALVAFEAPNTPLLRCTLYFGEIMTTYAIHSTSRAVTSRTTRAAQPSHKGLKQYVLPAQHRLIRGRPIGLSEEVLLANLAELRAKSDAGVIEVRTSSGLLVNLATLAVAPAVQEAPKRPPVLDTAANDKPAGEHKPIYPEGPTMQEAMDDGEIPGLSVDVPVGATGDEGEDEQAEVPGAPEGTSNKRGRRSRR